MTGKNIPNTAGITAEETHALFWYKIGQLGNYEMNAALRSGNANEIDKWGTYVRVLASALNKLPPFSGVAYRHADLTPTVIDGYKKGAIIFEFHLRSHAGHLIELQDTVEREVLILPNAAFRVLNVKKKLLTRAAWDPSAPRKMTTAIELEEVMRGEIIR